MKALGVKRGQVAASFSPWVEALSQFKSQFHIILGIQNKEDCKEKERQYSCCFIYSDIALLLAKLETFHWVATMCTFCSLYSNEIYITFLLTKSQNEYNLRVIRIYSSFLSSSFC